MRLVGMLVCCCTSVGAIHAQPKFKPMSIGYSNMHDQIYADKNTACMKGGVPEALEAWNYSESDRTVCGVEPTLWQSYSFQSVAVFENIIKDPNGPNGICRVRIDQTRTITGNANCRGEPNGTTKQTLYANLPVAKVLFCDKNAGWAWWGEGLCYRPEDPYHISPRMPSCGNPTSVGNGCKEEEIPLYSVSGGDHPIALRLLYANQLPHGSAGTATGDHSWFLDPLDRRLDLRLQNHTSLSVIVAHRGHGRAYQFKPQNDGTYKSNDGHIQLKKLNSPLQGWMLRDHSANLLEIYDQLGRLQTLVRHDGRGLSVEYSTSAELPHKLTTVFGRQLQFSMANQRLNSVSLADGTSIRTGYRTHSNATAGRHATLLDTVQYPDSHAVSFGYAAGVSTMPLNLDSGISWNDVSGTYDYFDGQLGVAYFSQSADPSTLGRSEFNLTHKRDEMGQPYASFQYDGSGRVVRSERSGGTSAHEFSYAPYQTQVRGPLGATMLFEMGVYNEQVRLASLRTSAPNSDHTTQYGYDEQGNVTSTFDSQTGTFRCYQVDPLTGAPVVELRSMSACPTGSLVTASPDPGSPKISTQWHPDWRLESRIAQPGKITTLVYNGQRDPTAGNAVTTCAPATAKLPDGKPIAVLCKRVEQATTDANGAAGFAATLQSGVAARVWRWTYNQYGQVLREDGPRTDVSDVTTYTYHAATSFTGTGANAAGVTLGDLATITNAAGQVTVFSSYNKHGQLLQSTDPNGVVTRYTYDLRQRPTSHSVGGQTTTYTYDAAGQLTRTTSPDGTWVGHTYDAAHRLITTFDSLGNRIEYTLDNAGNRAREWVKDPSGALRRHVERIHDALGRVQTVMGLQ